MQRREMLLGTATVATAALAGCFDLANGNDGATAPDGESRSIIVGGAGEVEAEPDLAVLLVGVEASGDDAEAVRSELAERGANLREALLEYGLSEDDITTHRFSMRKRHRRPRRHPEEGGEEEEPESYYEGTHAFEVEVDGVDDVGDVLDVAVDAGANDVSRVTFTLSEETREELREEALREALGDAREEAEVVADEIDAEIVDETVVDATGGGVRPVHADAGMAAHAPDAPPTDLHPDEVTVGARVEVEYRME